MSNLGDYKEMAKDKEKHLIMLKDISCLDFLEYSLDTEDNTTLETVLDIIKLFIDNDDTHTTLKSCSGLLTNMRLIDSRKNVNLEIKIKAKDLYRKLFNVPNHSNTNSPKRPVQNTYTFHVEGLYSFNEKKLETTVIKLKGVISIQVDSEHQRCVIRTMPSLDQFKIAQQIVDTTMMKPRLVTKNKFQQEIFLDILSSRYHKENQLDSQSYQEEENEEELPGYLPEEDDFQEAFHAKSILSFQYIKTNATHLIYSAAKIINTIYC